MLIDVHCHANLYLAFDEILKDARINGVEKIIAVGMSAISQERVIEIANRFDSVYPALGIHPEEVKENKDLASQLDQIEQFIKDNGNKLCAIGEIGLDHHFIKDKSLYSFQKEVFERMLAIAQFLKLPVNLHTKGAEKELFDLLPSYDFPHVNVHWYTGPEKQLKLGIERGYYFSITPAIKYSPPLKKTVQSVEIDHLLLESDGPVEYSGQTGVPSMVKDVLGLVSQIKNVPKRELETQICNNAKKVFPKLF